MTKLAITFLLGAAMLPAQFLVFAVENGVEVPATGLYALGSTPTDGYLKRLMRIRNIGTAMLRLDAITIAGTGFALEGEPPRAFDLLPQKSVDFYVIFRHDVPLESYGALRINTAAITLFAQSTGGVYLWLEAPDGTRVRRTVDLATVFPSPERGETVSCHFVVESFESEEVTVRLEGAGFQFQPAMEVVRIGPMQKASLEVSFRSASSGLKLGTLDVGGRRFSLQANVREPAFPRPLVTFSQLPLRNATQAKVEVRFDAVSRAEGVGQLRLEFTPASGTGDDAAISFLPANQRSVAFQVREGQQQAFFNGQKEMILQTGTTGGVLRLVAEMGGWTGEASATIEAAPVQIDSGRVLRGTDLLDVSITGFDNTRTVSEVAFYFYDDSGEAIAPGAIRTSVQSQFRSYFSNAPAGGMFTLRAVFPVSGPTSTITAMEAEFRNATGVQRGQRIRF